MSQSSNNRIVSRIRRRRGACKSCKERKIRCNGDRPCSTCRKTDLDCIYLVSDRRKSGQILPAISTFPYTLQHADKETREAPSKIQHGKHSRSIDSAIADCDFDMDSLRPVSSAISDPTYEVHRAPAIKNLAMIYLSKNRPSSNFKGTDSLLHQVHELLAKDGSTPVQVPQTFKTLVGKIDRLREDLCQNLAPSYQATPGHELQSIKSAIQAFFNCPLSSSYLSRNKIDKLLNVSSLTLEEKLSHEKSLIFAVGSLGCQIQDKEAESRYYFDLASESMREIISGSPSITKIQTLATMVLFSIDHQPSEQTHQMLSNAINMILSLGIYKSAEIAELCNSIQQKMCLKSLVWLLWSLEKVLCMRTGRPPIFAQGTIEFAPPQTSNSNGYGNCHYSLLSFSLESLSEYGHICSIINSKSNIPNNSSSSEHTDSIGSQQKSRDAILSLLDNLKEMRDIKPTTRSSEPFGELPDGRYSLKMLLLHHEAVLALCQGSLHFIMSTTDVSTHQSSASTVLQKSSRAILSLLGSASRTNIFQSRTLIMTYATAWSFVFVAMLKGHGQSDDVALLTIAAGIFAQASLSSISDPGFNEITELGSIAIQEYKKSKERTECATSQTNSQGGLPSLPEQFPAHINTGFESFRVPAHSSDHQEFNFMSPWLPDQNFDDNFWDPDPRLEKSWNLDPGAILDGLLESNENLESMPEDMSMCC